MRIAFGVLAATILVAASAAGQAPVDGLLGNYTKMMNQTFAGVERFCRYHGGVLLEGETEREYECVAKPNMKSPYGVRLTFSIFQFPPMPEFVAGIQIFAVLPTAQVNNAYQWFRRTGAWDLDGECPTGGYVKRCRHLYHESASTDGVNTVKASHSLNFLWQPKGQAIVQGYYVVAPTKD